MGKSTTEQKATSQDRGIIQGIGFKEFTAICQEYRAPAHTGPQRPVVPGLVPPL